MFEMLHTGCIVNNCYEVKNLIVYDEKEAHYLVETLDPPHEQLTLKEFIPHSQKEIEGNDRFWKRLSILSEVKHTNLLEIYEFFTEIPEGKSDKRHYVIMEYINGKTLQDIFQSEFHEHPLPCKVLLSHMIKVCSALKYLNTQHTEPIAFGVLRPKYIMLTQDRQLKLFNYGLGNLLRTEFCSKTPGFTPSDQITQGIMNEKTDVYSLGATMHYLLTGKNPEENPWNFDSILNYNEETSPELNDFISRCLSPLTEERPTLQEVYNFLLGVSMGKRPKTNVVPSLELPPMQKEEVRTRKPRPFESLAGDDLADQKARESRKKSAEFFAKLASTIPLTKETPYASMAKTAAPPEKIDRDKIEPIKKAEEKIKELQGKKEKDDSELIEGDNFYLALLEDLMDKKGNSLISFIIENRDKLDKRFMKIFDYKRNQSIGEDQEKANFFNYLNRIINNLKIRETLSIKEKTISREKSLTEGNLTSSEKPDRQTVITFSEEKDDNLLNKEGEEKKEKKAVKLDFIDTCLKKLIALGANELHLTTGEIPAYRLWGEIQTMDMPVFREGLLDLLINQLLTEEEKELLMKKMNVDFMYTITSENYETYHFRSNAYYHRNGLNVVMKFMPHKLPSFKELALPEIVSAFGRFRQGLVLVTGPSGSGKTTTLHALIDLINTERNAHIITIENPIEFIHSPKNSIIRQRQVDLHTKNYFRALKASIYEDPDVILVSELRDPETIQLSMIAAETGCLVLSTMNTISCRAAIERIIDFFPPDQRLQAGAILSETLKGIITQQILPSKSRSIKYPAFEIVLGCTPLTSLIREQKLFQINSLIETSKSIGMQTMDSSILNLLRDNLITQEVAYEYAIDKSVIDNFIQKELPSGKKSEQVSLIKKDKCVSMGIIMDPPPLPVYRKIEIPVLRNYTLEDLFKIMVEEKASDLHITVGLPPKLRLEGEIAEIDLPPVTEKKAWELMSGVLSKKQIDIFHREWDLDFTYDSVNLGRFRSNILKEQNGLGAIFRIIPPEIPSMEALGLPPVLKKIASYKQGLIIITGPTGSGKTTTMACLIDYINSTRHANILTIEKPLEFIHKNKKSRIFYREVGVSTPSFREAVRASRREYMDVIMIGEMIDKDTLLEAILAADMGNLVLGLMPTTGVIRTVEKIIETFSAQMEGQIRSMLCSSLRAIISQQLIPAMAGTGRCAIVEVAINNQRLANVIRDGKIKMMDSIIHSSRDEGMQSLDLALLQLVRDGKIDEETARLRSSNPRSFIVPTEFKSGG